MHDMKALIEELKPIHARMNSSEGISDEEARQILSMGSEIERVQKGYQCLEELGANPDDTTFLPVLEIPGLDADQRMRRLQDVSGKF